MEYRYFKCPLNVELISTLKKQWLEDREKRNELLNRIFAEIPFYEHWRGSEEWCIGIVCRKDNPEFEKIKSEKYYKIENLRDEQVVIRGNNRYKLGKAFNEKLNQIEQVLKQYPSFNRFMLKKLKLSCWAYTSNCGYGSSCGVVSEHFIVKIPDKKGEFGGDKFPEIPNYLTEIKESEFLALQGK